MNKVNESISKLRRAANSSLNRVRKVSGKSNDEDLLIYEQLTDADFKKLSEKYGEESVEKYIKTMEARRMKNAS